MGGAGLDVALVVQPQRYRALISKRVYKEPMPHEEAVEVIATGAGSHFDPDVVEAFLRIKNQFYEISQRYGDADPT